MRAFLCAVVVGASIFGATAAAAEMSHAFENTVVSRYPDGGWVKHWFNRDGSYAAEFSDGRRLSARWSVSGDRICLTRMRPNMLIPRFCTRMVEAEVGQTWQSRDPLGRRVQNVMVAGR
jgi:hypothetical protein